MSIGALRHYITIKRIEWKSDGYGGQIQDKTKTKKVYAQVKTATGTEAITEGAIQNTKTRTLIIRNTDIRPSDFILMDGEEFNISNIERYDDKPDYLLVNIRGKEVSGV